MDFTDRSESKNLLGGTPEGTTIEGYEYNNDPNINKSEITMKYSKINWDNSAP